MVDHFVVHVGDRFVVHAQELNLYFARGDLVCGVHICTSNFLSLKKKIPEKVPDVISTEKEIANLCLHKELSLDANIDLDMTVAN